jgi:hypothetical protein
MLYSNHLISSITSVTISGLSYNHHVPSSITTMQLLSQVLTIRERRRLKLISTSYEFISNTNPYFPHWGHVGSPIVQLRYNRGSDQRYTLRDTMVSRLFKPCLPTIDDRSLRSCLPTVCWSTPRTSLLPPMCALKQNGAWPALSYLASWSKWLIWPAKC